MKLLTYSLALFCCIFFSNCKQAKQETIVVQTDEEVAQILQTYYDEFFDAWENGNPEKCLSMMTPDYVNYLNYGTTQNFQEVKDMFLNMSENNTIRNVKYKKIELFVHVDMAYEFGYFEQDIIPNNEGDTINAKSRTISVFKKHDGNWKLHRWMPQPKMN